LRSAISSVSSEYAKVWDTDPGTLRSVAEEIEEVAGYFGADVSDITAPLVEEADNREQSDKDEAGFDDEESDERWRDYSRSSSDVEDMFGGLVQEIRERTGR